VSRVHSRHRSVRRGDRFRAAARTGRQRWRPDHHQQRRTDAGGHLIGWQADGRRSTPDRAQNRNGCRQQDDGVDDVDDSGAGLPAGFWSARRLGHAPERFGSSQSVLPRYSGSKLVRRWADVFGRTVCGYHLLVCPAGLSWMQHLHGLEQRSAPWADAPEGSHFRRVCVPRNEHLQDFRVSGGGQ